MSPAGNEPLLSVNEAPPMAPLWVKVWLNGRVRGAGGRGRIRDRDRLAGDDERVRRSDAGATVGVGRADCDREEPPCVGVPERTPVAELSVRPVGSVPELSANVTAPIRLPA